MSKQVHPEIIIRDADPERDLSGIVLLNRLVQDLHAEAEPATFRPSDDMPEIEAFHAQFMIGRDEYTIVAELDGKVVGYVCGAVRRREASTFRWRQEWLTVEQIAVHPACRRMGVGRALMHRVGAMADDLELAEVALDTWQFNAEARRFFEQLGYTVYNVRLRKRC